MKKLLATREPSGFRTWQCEVCRQIRNDEPGIKDHLVDDHNIVWESLEVEADSISQQVEK